MNVVEAVRIAVLNSEDAVCGFMDNQAPDAMHYYDDELHEYLQGAANTYTFKTDARTEDSVYLTERAKLAFKYNGRDYYLSIMRVTRDEFEVEVEAWSMNFEMLNEYARAYDPQEAKTLVEYLDYFDAEHVLTLGRNEVSDKAIKHKWEGTDTILARIFSLATTFGAEAEFIPVLNRDYSLKQITLNVYRKRAGADRGVGSDRTDIILRYGVNIAGVKKTSDVTELYTAIRPYGTDGLMISDLDKVEYDEDGNVEFISPPGDDIIRAVQARERFPSYTFPNSDRYIVVDWDCDTKNVNTLYGRALAELKKNCEPKVTYDIDGFYDTRVGDMITIVDDEYNPPLYLTARVAEQIRSFTDTTKNKTTFSNFTELESEIAYSLLSQMNALIAANKVYEYAISSSRGIVFKKNSDSTVLTASVMDVGTDITDDFIIRWKKDGEAFSEGKTITVKAAEITERAVYRFEAIARNGVVKGFSEVTVVYVKDGDMGKSERLHIRYSDDGGKTFTDNSGKTPGKWIGQYVDLEEYDSELPEVYAWTKVEGEDAVTVYIHSSAGTAFKNNDISTTLTVTIYCGGKSITNKAQLTQMFGGGAYLEWSIRKQGDPDFTIISALDTHLSDGGFKYTVNSEDIDTQAAFNVQLIVD